MWWSVDRLCGGFPNANGSQHLTKPTPPRCYASNSGTGAETDSCRCRTVAEVFEKQHEHALDSIDALSHHGWDFGHGSDGWFRQIMAPHTTVSGRMDRSFETIRDGMTLLAMGFTGSKAMRFKMLYIATFNEMEKQALPAGCA